VLQQQALELARRRQRQRYVRQSLARVLHGPVQASLLAITARVERAGRSDGERCAAELAGAAAELRELRDRIAAPIAESWEAGQALERVVPLWTDILDVRVDCPPAVLARVNRAPATRAALVDVVAEALTNAMRHGGAREVHVSVAIEGVDRLAVVVRDDGSSDGAGLPGLGSRLYDVLALDWEGVYGRSGGRLRVIIPFAGEAAAAASPEAFG
jgi:signal transduction histidine kinase